MNEEIIRQFADYLLDGREQDAWDFLDKHRFMPRKDVLEQIITPAMRHIGDLWEQNLITVADEHLATGICDFLISRLFPPRPGQTPAKKAMFLCVEGEMHYLGLKMVRMLFEENGWETHYYGPNLPLEYALKKAEAWKPDVIGLSVAIVYHLPRVKTYVEALSKLPHKPKIIIGGRMAGKYLSLPSDPRSEIIDSLDDAMEWLKRHGTGDLENAYS